MQIPDLVQTVEVLPCGLGEVPKDAGASCQRCDQRVYSLWSDPRVSAAQQLRQALAAFSSMEADGRNYDAWLQVQASIARNTSLVCDACPANAECLGGAVVVPVAGYWHSSPNSTRMHECPQPAACRGDKLDTQERILKCQVLFDLCHAVPKKDRALAVFEGDMH